MGKCKICGLEAGLFSKLHKACKDRKVLYVGSHKSKKFHKPDCRYAKGELEDLYSFGEAMAKQYIECKVCKPRS